MRQALVADLHLTSEAKDAYRWGLFPWLLKQQWDELYILGDLTDRKDKHPSLLVNTLVDVLVAMTDQGRRDVHILKGNHDCIDPALPFFLFARHLPNIHYFNTPERFQMQVGYQPKSLATLPFWPADQHPWEQWPSADYALFHGTVVGSVTENGTVMPSGVPSEAFTRFKKVWAGDIHVPQSIGNVEYVGSPYHIHYGDHFTPRVVILNDWEYETDLHFPTIRKELVVVRCQEDLGQLNAMPAGSQVKVRVQLPYKKAGEWESYRDAVLSLAELKQLHLGGLELVTDKPEAAVVEAAETVSSKPDKDVVREYGKMEKLSDTRTEVGVFLVEDAA